MRAAHAVLALSMLGLCAPAVFAQEGDRVFAYRDLHATGSGVLGVRIRDVSKDDVSSLKLPGEHGVIVKDVDSEGPGGKAGLRQDDVITKFQGETVQSASQFQRLVRETPPGRSVSIEVLRAGKAVTLNANVAAGGPFFAGVPLGAPQMPDMPQMPEMPPMPEMRGFALGPAKLGIRFEEIGGQLAQYFKLEGQTGILVVDVEHDGAAGKAGLKAGDVVVKVDGKPVQSGRAFLDAIHRLEGGSTVVLGIIRDGQPQDVHVTVGAAKDKASEPTI
jgi:S1-C subfamily serine protease